MLAPWRASADFFKQSRSLNESSSPTAHTREAHVNRKYRVREPAMEPARAYATGGPGARERLNNVSAS